MKFTVNRLLMHEAVKTVIKIISKNKEIPEISGILIEADADSGILTVTGIDIRTHIQRRLRSEHIEESGSIILTPILAEILRLLGGETVSFECDKRLGIKIQSSRACYTVPFFEASAFPKLRIPFPEDTIQIKGINSLIKRTVFATDGTITDYAKASFSYVKLSFEDGVTRAEATYGSCMAVVSSPHCADGNLEMILHEKALHILSGIVRADEELYVGIVGKYAIFMKEDLFFSTMMFTGRYVEASKLIDKIAPAYGATVDARRLFDSIDHAATVFETGDDKYINFRIEANKMCIQAKTAARSVAASVDTIDSVPTPPEGFHYHPRLLTDCLRHMTGPVKLSIDTRGFILMEANGCRYFVCPRGAAHIKENKSEEKKKPKSKTTKLKTAAIAA